MNPQSSRLLWQLQKKRHLIDVWFRVSVPISSPNAGRQRNSIIYRSLHSTCPFRSGSKTQCAYLADNGYHTVDGEELTVVMSGQVKPRPRSVAVTFDDGLKQVWTVAYPILKKYGLKAIVFLVPGCIPEDESATSEDNGGCLARARRLTPRYGYLVGRDRHWRPGRK